MMASKPKVSLRKKHRLVKEVSNVIVIDEDPFDEVRSPTRSRGQAGQTSVLSPRFRSQVATPTSKKGRPKSSAEDTSLDESYERLSQVPTPSKWSCLLPDYQSSQTDGVAGEVLWDCASPDAIKHLRRRQKGDKSIKEIVKHFKDGGQPKEGAEKSPALQLQLLRTSLQQQLHDQQHPHNNTINRQQRKLVRKRKQMQESKEQAKHLFGQILSKRQELETQEGGAQQSEQPMAVSHCEALSTDCDDDEPEDGWEDDDLFEDNSFILTATQNPQQLLGASSADSKPSERELDTCVPVPDVSDSIIQFEECFHLSNSSSVLDSQNSAVIPPTFVPGGVKTTFRRSIVTAGLNKALCGRKNEFQRVPVKDLPSTGSAAKVTSASNSCATVSAKLESPRSRFQLQRQKTSITPKRLVQPNKAVLNPVDKQENPTLISDRRPPSTVQSDQQRKAIGPMLITGHAQSEVQNGTQICLPPDSVSATQGKQNAHSGSKVYVPSASMSKSDAMSHQFPGNGSSSLSHAVNTILNKPASVQSHSVTSVSNYTKFVDRQNCDEKQIEKFPGDRRNLRSASVKSKTTSQHKLSDDLSDDGLSDELLLKLTEQECAFDSQAIQEFPTQAPAKLSAPVTLTSNKPSNTHSDDFGDDLDADLLATICDFDSFLESPGLGKKMKDRLTVGVHMKNGSTNTKDGGLQRNNSLAACGSGSDVMNGGRKCSVAVNQVSVSKPNTRSNSGGHNHRHWASTTTSENKSSSKSLNIPHQESTHKHLVYPPFAQQKTTRPLSSLAAGNSIFEKKSESVKKFVFKSVNASGCATSALPSGSISLHHRPDLSKQCHGKLDDGCTELDDDSDDDMMADDALYESQIIALLDEVESQATQQTASQLVDTKGPDSPPRCSQEQIEKKRQAAMQRKLRSKTRTN